MYYFITELVRQPIPLFDVAVKKCSRSFYQQHQADVSIIQCQYCAWTDNRL